jgi:hypothetical protein
MKVYIQNDKGGFLYDEFYFLIYDLFKEFKFELFSKEDIEIKEFELGQVIIFTSNLIKFEEIKELVKLIKPRIIVHLSDEVGDKPEYNELGNMCELYLRQYNHRHYSYTENSYQIPLGYTNYGFHNINVIDKFKIKNINPYKGNRSIDWSFIGWLKSDRHQMISVMSKIENNWIGNTENINEVVDVYLNSKFVASGRGNFSLDCFRLYEACACGSIPIVVGDEYELKSTFNYDVYPPWLFCKNWEEARLRCEEILKDDMLVEKMRISVIDWWMATLNNFRSKINSVFN